MSIKSFIYSFLKFQAAAIIATGVDFGVYFLLKYGIGKWYLLATFIGALLGAITNFIILRYWATKSTKNKLSHQAGKYSLVAAGSLFLNTSLVYLFTELFYISSDISKVAGAIIVAISYNFILQKYFVFKA